MHESQIMREAIKQKNSLCPGCYSGNCYIHQYDYMTTDGAVRLCKCVDPDHKHGKIEPKKS